MVLPKPKRKGFISIFDQINLNIRQLDHCEIKYQTTNELSSIYVVRFRKKCKFFCANLMIWSLTVTLSNEPEIHLVSRLGEKHQNVYFKR